MTLDRRTADQQWADIDARIIRIVAEETYRVTWGDVVSVGGRTMTVAVEGAAKASPGWRWYGQRPKEGQRAVLLMGPPRGKRIGIAVDAEPDEGVQVMEGWLTPTQRSVTLGMLPARSYVEAVRLQVLTGFDSSGTDTVVVGTMAVPDAFALSQAVDTPGLFTATMGVLAGYVENEAEVTAIYTAGGTAPTVGQVYVYMRWWRVKAT